MPPSLKEIDYSAFFDCVSLETVVFSSAIDSIGEYAFANAHRLKEIYFLGDCPAAIDEIVDLAASFVCFECTLYYVDGNTTFNKYISTFQKKGFCWEKISKAAADELFENVYPGLCMHTEKTMMTKATFTANGKVVTKCTTCNAILSSKLIYKANSVNLSKTKYTYDGKIKKPAVTVKNSVGKVLQEGTDYTVSYSKGRVKTGRYKAVVTLKGKFAGTKTLYFTIVPKAPATMKAVL